MILIRLGLSLPRRADRKRVHNRWARGNLRDKPGVDRAHRSGLLGRALDAAERACARLSATGVRMVDTPRALAELLSTDASGRDSRPRLRRAVASAPGNTDIYRPSEEKLIGIAVALTTFRSSP
jgi:hypothetical protein